MTEIREFRENEITIIKHWDKQQQKYVSNAYPKVGGRLRLAHETNDGINIESKIYQYNENLAVVIATVKTMNGQFTGIGMSSVERDQKIAPAILELAETRGIARALRFAGYGVEYCSAEEISHLENGNDKPIENRPPAQNHAHKASNGGNGNGNDNYKKPAYSKENGGDNGNNSGNGGSNGGNEGQAANRKGAVQISFDPAEGSTNVYKPRYDVHEYPPHDDVPTGNWNGNNGNGNGNGNKNRQLSHKQWSYIKSMGRKLGYDFRALTELCVSLFNVEIEGLNTSDASSFIDYLQSGKMIVKSVPAEA